MSNHASEAFSYHLKHKEQVQVKTYSYIVHTNVPKQGYNEQCHQLLSPNIVPDVTFNE